MTRKSIEPMTKAKLDHCLALFQARRRSSAARDRRNSRKSSTWWRSA